MEGKPLKKKYAYKPPNFFQRNFSFAGTMTAGEFWSEFGMHLITIFCVVIVLSIVFSATLPWDAAQLTMLTEAIAGVLSLGNAVSLVALSRRRLRDAGYSAKSYLWLLVPVLGGIALIARLCSKSAECVEQ